MKEFNFVGPNQEEIAEQANEALVDFRISGKERFEGEEEKTQLQLELIRTTNQILRIIFKHFNIEKEYEITVDQVHFLNKVAFEKYVDPETTGQYSSISGAICINTDKTGSDKAHQLAILLHESVHGISEQFFYATKQDNDLVLYDARVGLRTSSQWENKETKLRGLNEFVVNSVVYYSLDAVSDTLEKRFGIKKSDLQKPIYGSGSRHSDFFNKIMEAMVADGVNTQTFITELIQSHFSGSLEILNKIDEVFGSGSLRALGYLDAYITEGNDETNNLVEEYFLRADKERKTEILKTLDSR